MTSSSTPISRRDLAHDLVLPTLLFVALGAMTWAVRGCAGAGGMNAHVAPGLTWGAAWWFLANDRQGAGSRRYNSGWILLALAAGFAIAGERGWMQWPSFFDGQLTINYAKREFVPISRAYGFLWFFIAGSAWAGLPACMLAWCASGRPMRAWEWTLRIACGFGGAYLAWRVFAAYPRVFLPLYDSLQAKYLDFQANPNLSKLYRDNGSSMRMVGFYLGFLLFEIGRKDWQNVKLILSVGLMTGVGWAACQNWRWAARVWPDATFNFGRCWEVSGGIAIGIGFGMAYYLVNRKASPEQPPTPVGIASESSRNREWLLAAALLLLVGATMFWPTPRDLRRPVGLAVSGPHYLLGLVYVLTGIMCAGLIFFRWIRRPNWQLRGELVLMLVLSWFIKTQMASLYGDGVADGRLAGLFGPGSIYFGITVAYVIARLLSPRAKSDDPSTAAVQGLDLDWLVTYLGLTIIAVWCLSVGLINGWYAPIWFGIVAAAFGIVCCKIRGRFPGTWLASNENLSSRSEDPNLEQWGIYLGLVYGLGLSLRKALKGGTHLYGGDENVWDTFFWNWVSLGMLVCLVVGAFRILSWRRPKEFQGNVKTSGIIWLVLIAQNALAQVVTGPLWGPHASWNEYAFNILYVVLFCLTAAIVVHYQLWEAAIPPHRTLSPRRGENSY